MTQPNYAHSYAFAQLKRVQERIASNATTPQYLKALDNMLLNAVRPLILNTDVAQDFIANLLGWQERNRKRKASFLDPDEFRLRAVVWLCTPAAVDRVATFGRLSLDRGAVIEMCSAFLSQTAPYLNACQSADPNDVESIALKQSFEEHFRTGRALIAVVREVQLWFDRAVDFRSQILEKYIRLAITKAQYDYSHVFKLTVPLDDLVQSYVLAAGRAIDKCDHTQGVLTNHVTNWLLTARAHMLKHVPHESTEDLQHEPAQNTFLSAQDSMESTQSARNLLLVAKLLDPDGFGRAFLGLTDVPLYAKS